jgi:glycosyltransferase involved in cell wall biosynthesis
MTGQDLALISTIIPVYNCERYLAEAIQSVLAQDYRPLEVIVVDDGSADASADVARSLGPQVKVYEQAHLGIAAARNLGMRLAEGTFLAFLDADDLWTEGKLTLQMAAFDQDAALDMVFGHVIQFHSPDLDPVIREQITYAREVMPAYIVGSMLIRRQAFLRTGPFSSEWRVGEFIDWYLRAQETGLRSLMLTDVVLRRRLHADNLGIRERGSRADYTHIIKAAMDRRRAVRCEGKGEG